MEKNTLVKWPKYLLLLLFFSQLGMAQLSNFTLNVVRTNETCTANGTLTWTTTGTTPGATMLYSIYLLPNTTTPIATVSGNTYGGLVAGNYRVVATQSLGTQNGSQQQDVTITNQIVTLTYQLAGQNSLTCANTGVITVNVTSGAAVSYEIFAGPMIRPLQPSNTFTGLSAGVYQVRVFDACGDGVVQTYTLTASPAGLTISAPVGSPPQTCGTVTATHILTAGTGNLIAYPLTVVLTLFPPSGPPIVYNQTITSGNGSTQTLTENIAMYVNQGYTYNLSITDACGNVYIKNNNNASSSIVPTAQASSMSCGLSQIFIRVIQTAVLVSAPAAYSNPLPYNYTPNIALGALAVQNVPPGQYTFNVTDVCGNPHVLVVDVPPPTILSPSFAVKTGCGANSGSVLISSPNGPMVSIVMTQAPAAYGVALPQNVAFNLSAGNNTFFMNSLPVGTYKFHLVDSCGNQFDVTIPVQGHLITTNTYTITQNCNSFNLELHYASNNQYANTFWLQKYNQVTGQWVHPATGVVYTPGATLTGINAVSLTNNIININLAYSGHFRIVMNYGIFGNGVPDASCFMVLNEFDFDGAPKIIDVASFSCNSNASDAIVTAVGLAPLIYRITTKNGLPFLVQNGNSNLFLGLQPAIYNFQVEDACGNIVNSLHDITTPFSFQITPANFCNGQTASLTVASFPFLIYRWWKSTAPGTTLSTTSQLLFPSFNGTTNQGTYFVSITNPNNASCINQTLSFVVSPGGNNPNAGNNGSASYCAGPSNINLFTLLGGPYDANGTWSALSSGGVLSGNTWNATGVAAGTYQFRYTVTGFCNLTDDALVTITINAAPQTPVASANPIFCATLPMQLFATAVPNNATYQWTGPNNFTSTQQNPIIPNASAANSGTYTVQASLNGCVSGSSSVTVQVAPLPNIGNITSTSYCGSQTTIDLFTLLSGNYDPNGTWTALSPGGVLTNNIWDATGLGAGVYQFSYTLTSACSTPITATGSITLNPVAQSPVASAPPVVCNAQQLQLFATPISNATYQWSGPNGFTSSLQNPIINNASTVNNGVYTVQAIQNGCPSATSSVTVQVTALPQFNIAFDCIDNAAVLTATPVSGSFDGNTAVYQWSNAQGFASSDNPVAITGESPGVYSLTVTNTNGCFNTNTIDVPNTLCSIPSGISPNNDGLNDAFDLSGFTGITHVKIFNRYGMVVFDQANYVKEWIGQDKKGNMLPSATYFYLVNFENEGPKTGWVYLIREN